MSDEESVYCQERVILEPKYGVHTVLSCCQWLSVVISGCSVPTESRSTSFRPPASKTYWHLWSLKLASNKHRWIKDSRPEKKRKKKRGPDNVVFRLDAGWLEQVLVAVVAAVAGASRPRPTGLQQLAASWLVQVRSTDTLVQDRVRIQLAGGQGSAVLGRDARIVGGNIRERWVPLSRSGGAILALRCSLRGHASTFPNPAHFFSR